jgi:hypothetical protein
MSTNKNQIFRFAASLVFIGLTSGCDSPDERLVAVSREASDRQAEQNRQIARQNEEIAETTRQLVDADAQARKELIEADAAARKELINSQAEAREELIAMQQGLQERQAVVDQARDELEAERREIVQDRYWDSLLGQAVGAAVLLLASILPLVLCWYLLHGLRRGNDSDQDLTEWLTLELVAEAPSLIPRLAELQSGDQHAYLPAPGDRESDELDDPLGDPTT